MTDRIEKVKKKKKKNKKRKNEVANDVSITAHPLHENEAFDAI